MVLVVAGPMIRELRTLVTKMVASGTNTGHLLLSAKRPLKPTFSLTYWLPTPSNFSPG